MRAAIYCRISLDRNGEGLGVERQREDCERLCAARGWDVAATYIDNDISAYSGKRRPQYEAVLAAVAAGEIGAVVAYAPDRLYRRLRDLLDFTDVITAAHAEVATVAAGSVDLTTARGLGVANILGSIAQMESQTTGERQRRKMVEVAERGRPHGGVRAYGFERDGVTVNEREAAVIREVTEGLLGGASLRSLCLRLNERGDKTSTGGEWDLSVMSRMLLRVRLIGQREHNGAMYPASWPAIITPAEQIQLRAILTRRHRDPSRDRRHPLSGIVLCGICGSRMRYIVNSGRNLAHYACPGKPRGNACMTVVASGIERVVNERAVRIGAARANRTRQTATTMRDTSADRARLDQLADAFANGALTMEQLLTATATLRARIAESEAHNATQAQAQVEAATEQRVSDRWERWDELTPDEQHTALRTVIERVVVSKSRRTRIFDPQRVEIVWRGDDDVAAGIDALSDSYNVVA